MKKPDFLIVGAAKSGTTSLFHYLNNHPKIYIPYIKECRFFSQLPTNFKGLGAEFFVNSGIRDKNDYFGLFKNYEDKVCGDISNDYLYYYDASISNIKRYLGKDVKIIIILRNPIDRAYSNYMHHVRDGWEDCSFEEALIKESWRIKHNWAWPYHYVKVGMYFNQVKAYLKNFNNVKVFLFEDLKKELFYKELFNFIGVDYIKIETNKVYNFSGIPKIKFIQNLIRTDNFLKKIIKSLISSSSKDKLLYHIQRINLRKIEMKEETREYLKEIYKDDVYKLSDLIKRDLSFWIT